MTTIRSGAAALLLGLLATLAMPQAPAQPAAPPAPDAAASSPADAQGTQYSDKGADTCLRCHDEEADTLAFTTAGIFKGRHAHRRDPRSPFGAGGLQCEACHGPGARHSVERASGSERKRTINSLKADSTWPVEQRNAPCLECHQGSARSAWHAGAHAGGAVACTDCHKLHVERDPLLAKASEPEVCFRCHQQQRGDFRKASTHPVRHGSMACSNCHNPHGTSNVAMLNQPTLNQTCWGCHADKRGPLLWEHAPVAEDCSLCHRSHGSVHAALLTKSAPLLCQQCHTAAGHPSVARTGAALPGNGGTGGMGAIFVVAGSCTNCHSQVHGSNHPAGAKLMR